MFLYFQVNYFNMKQIMSIALMSACGLSAQTVTAQNAIDTVKVQQVAEVVVKGVRATKNAPFAVANINKSELKNFLTSGKELPFLFSRTPGVVAWSDNGTGVGNASLRIRGAAGSRINVTLDGVCLNSPEDQSVFWANMNSYSALMGSAQIQRGVGTSTNGDGAFGGSISIATAAPSLIPTAELTGSYGSFGTYNTGISFSTGLLGKHLIFDGAYHESATQGYVNATDGRAGSYYGGLTWLGDNFQIRYKNIGNFEKTGQAWNGVMTSDYNTNGLFPNIHSYKDLWEAGLGRVNTLVEDVVYDPAGWAAGNYQTQRYTLRDGSKWQHTTDNFYQNHNILSAAWTPSAQWSHNLALHYTYGQGYYKELKHQTSLAKKFGLPENKDYKDDAIRKKGLTQNAYGMVYNVTFKNDNWDVMAGTNLQRFSCNHWGYLTYIGNQELEQKYFDKNGKYKYYDSDADKNDYSAFIKATYSFLEHWNVFADVQYRHVDYTTDGLNDKFVKKDGKYVNYVLNVDEKFNFFNPKAGISYTNGAHKAYASVAMSNREPERNNYTDNGGSELPKAEKLIDTEFGYQYTGNNWFAGANFYYMSYDNQLVQTGKLSDIGEPLTTNIKDSYRMGVELSAGWSPLSWLSLQGNAALSQNKIKNWDEEVESWDEAGSVHHNHYDKSTLAYSPSAILNGFIDFHYQGFAATWHTNFVSKQYVDNTESDERSLPCYSQSDLQLSFQSDVTKAAGIKNVKLGLDFNNIFNRHYAANGYTWYGWYNGGQRYAAMTYMPMAGFNVMGHVTLKF